ncbi:cis-aconitate decarboxylase-like [Pelobates cultripes]|nr:cis-aconitate decarboxylase-like [Pelobates cultripes]
MELVSNLQTMNITSNRTYAAFQYSVSNENPNYTDYKPVEKELIPIPKAVLYILMAGLVVVAAVYAIVGHLIKDLAHDIADCILGPQAEGKDCSVDMLKTTNTTFLPVAGPSINVYQVQEQDQVCVFISKSCECQKERTTIREDEAQ